MIDETYYFVRTNSIHQIIYLVKAPLDLTKQQAEDIIRVVDSENTPIEVNQKWVNEEVVDVIKLTESQIRELNLRIKDDENDFTD